MTRLIVCEEFWGKPSRAAFQFSGRSRTINSLCIGKQTGGAKVANERYQVFRNEDIVLDEE